MSTDVTTPELFAPEPEIPAETAAAPSTNSAPANKPLWQLVLGAIVVIGTLYLLGGWAVPFVIFAIVLMVVMHELGHYLTAKWTGMKSTEFFVGFGPRLWSKQIGETEWGLKAIVAGGYVRILGMTTNEELDELDEPRSFRQATYPRRVLVASAGSLMHLLLAFILAWCSLVFFGQVTSHTTEIGGFTAFKGASANAAQAGGLHKGDVVVSVNGFTLHNDQQFISRIQASPDTTMTLVVDRDGHPVTLHVTPANASTTYVKDQQGQWTIASTTRSGLLGVYITSNAVRTPVSLIDSIPATFSLIGNVLNLSIQGLAHIFSPSGVTGLVHQVVNTKAANNPQLQDSRPISIIGMVNVAVQSADQNPSSLFVIFMLINIGVGLVNMLPMLPLDGGYVAIATYERFRTKKGAPAYHADVNKLTPVVYAFLMLLLVIFASSVYLDITHPLHL